MKKILHKFLPLFLAFSFSFAFFPKALAVDSPILENHAIVSSTEILLSKQDGHILSILGEDLANGDLRFSLLDDGEIVSMSYVDRSNCEIIWTGFDNGVATISNTKPYSPPTRQGLMTAPGYTYVGKVRYNHYVQGMIMAINSIDWSYSTNTNPASSVDLNGYYRDIADFAASIVGFLGLGSTKVAIEIAGAVLAAFGLGGSPGEILVPSYIVSCKRTEVNWLAEAGSRQKFYQGFRCVVTHPNKSEQVVIEGDYYPITAIDDHNENLALAPYSSFYPGSERYEVKSWPS